MTLIETLKNLHNYDSNWAVYAPKNQDGKFTEDSPCRFGQTIFENGGLLDDYEYFGDNASIMDAIDDYYGGGFEPEIFDSIEFDRWIVLFEEDAVGTPPTPCDWGGNKRNVIDYIIDNHQDRYNDLYFRWTDFNHKEFSTEAAQLVIERAN